mgnify:CR=1 FL=1
MKLIHSGWFWIALSFILSFLNLSCGKERPIPANSLEGTWKITEVSTTDPTRDTARFQNLITTGHEIHWKIEGSNGQITFRLPSSLHSNCSLTTQYSVKYCCAKMRKLFLTKIAGSTQESTPGCLAAAGLAATRGSTSGQFHTEFSQGFHLEEASKPESPGSRIKPDTFHFTYTDGYHVTLEGPYQDAKTTLKLELLP